MIPFQFRQTRSMDSFLHLYTQVTKDDIRRNRDNVGELLGL
jgi:hypothetical protein